MPSTVNIQKDNKYQTDMIVLYKQIGDMVEANLHVTMQ